MKNFIAITGASSGIGECLAKTFSAAGYPLLLLARRKSLLEKLNLPNTLCESVDVTDYEAVKAAIQKAEDKFGPIGCLINNAGVMLLGNADKQEFNEWSNMIDVNVKGILTGISSVLEKMILRKTGTIINISSIAGRKTFPNHAIYCGTKFAVHAISENIREEVAPHNIRVITIAPGVVETNLLEHTTSDDIKDGYKDWKKTIGGGLTPENIAASVIFAYEQPQHVCIREIVIAKTTQAQ